ncbi:MAG: hypothetical protein ABIH49_00620 [archaeon]
MNYEVLEEAVLPHFEGCYRLGKARGMIAGNHYDTEQRQQEGARVFRDLILGKRERVTFKSLKPMAQALRDANFVGSVEYGKELIPSLFGLGFVNYSNGGPKFGSLHFRTDEISNGTRNGKQRTRKIYIIENRHEEIAIRN